MDEDKAFRDQAKQVWSRYSLLDEVSTLKDLDDVIPTLVPQFQSLAKSFRYNLASAIATTGLPSLLAALAAGESFFRIHQYRKMLLAIIDSPEELSESDKAEILRSAREALQKDLLGSGEGERSSNMELVGRDIERLLLQVDHLAPGIAPEVLRQGVVLVWGAFEVFCRDFFVSYLNQNPTASLALMNDPTTKRLFPKIVDLDVLTQYDFDLSSSMGVVLSSIFDIGSCSAIKSVFSTLFPGNEALRTALSKSEIWLLSQARNLVVHQRGIVDTKYKIATGSDAPEGSELVVAPKDLKGFTFSVRDAGIAVLNATKQHTP
jgi:hypothetical protein